MATPSHQRFPSRSGWSASIPESTTAITTPGSPVVTSQASSTRAFTIGVAGGVTIPTGDAGDFWDTGFNVMGTLGFRPATLPVRADHRSRLRG